LKKNSLIGKKKIIAEKPKLGKKGKGSPEFGGEGDQGGGKRGSVRRGSAAKKKMRG